VVRKRMSKLWRINRWGELFTWKRGRWVKGKASVALAEKVKRWKEMEKERKRREKDEEGV
jgi:hypothetical protein